MKKIDDQNEIQFRQINPTWMESDGPSRLAFIPTKKDNDKLSLDRSVSLTAKDSFSNFTSLGLRSDGVYGIMPCEFAQSPNPIECFESPLVDNKHHSHADFNGMSNSERKAKSLELKRFAILRGKLHP